METDDLIKAHKKSIYNREEIEASEVCGCFYCFNIFPPEEIYEWTDKKTTALCPRCGIDSVLADASGLPVTDKSFLKEMEKHWFSPVLEVKKE